VSSFVLHPVNASSSAAAPFAPMLSLLMSSAAGRSPPAALAAASKRGRQRLRARDANPAPERPVSLLIPPKHCGALYWRAKASCRLAQDERARGSLHDAWALMMQSMAEQYSSLPLGLVVESLHQS
jgi:hypothetical protein